VALQVYGKLVPHYEWPVVW